jgi:hypothetical protein
MTCASCGLRPATLTIAAYRGTVRTTIPDPVCDLCWSDMQEAWAEGNGPYSLQVVKRLPENIVA